MEKSFFPYIIAFLWIGSLILLGTFIRAKVKFFQNFLFPGSLIGGLIGFVLMRFDIVGGPTSSGWQTIAEGTFSMITFHLFAFSFVGIGLLKNDSPGQTSSKGIILQGSWWMALLFGLLFAVQALIGYGGFYLWKIINGGDFFVGNGYLLGAGFTQGPGQTQAYATIWETNFNVVNALDVGLAFAAVGFLAAGLVGVPLTRYGLKKGWIASIGELPRDYRVGLLDKGNNPPCARATTHSANVDSIGFHLAVMCLVYGLGYAFALAWANYFPILGLRGIGYGYLFVWAMTISMIIRKILDKGGVSHLIDSESTRRLTNTTVDFLVCGIFMGIRPHALQDVVVPFFGTIIVAAAVTTVLCIWFGRRAPGHGFARAVTMFGYCTGTAASALMLLRLVDPEFKTPVALEVGVMALITCFITFTPVAMSMPFAPQEGFPMAWIFAGIIAATMVIMYAAKFIKKDHQF